ncbi:MAG: 3-methyl-2-oxobutanoate hydroxymethyltransferase [Verrucomicrobiales bacterium]
MKEEKAARFRALKGVRPIATLTAYDYPVARLLDEAGIDLLLVGDSLGMVVLGYPDTTHVTMPEMLHHTAAVARGAEKALVLADLPIHSYRTPEEALTNARRLIEAGAEAVKLEGGLRQVEKIKTLVAAGIPVMGHLGMLPQRVLEEGGYKKKGKTVAQREALIEAAQALEEAGVFGIVLESVVPESAAAVTAAVNVPTIGIGCGEGTCDGEVAVITDLIASFPWFVPPFAKPRAAVAEEISRAVQQYRQALGNRDSSS